MVGQERAPLWEALIAHRKRHAVSFHVPGHKSGTGLDEDAVPVLGGAFSIDFTEIDGLDNLHQPEGAIADAQRLAAELYGTEHTFFLVGGSTAGNLSLILSVCKPGDLLVVQRNAHKSILNGLMLAGARAVFLSPRLEPRSGLPGGVCAEDVEEALRRHPDAVGVMLTDPNYYGLGTDLRPIVQTAHRRGVPVMIDAAHGAHYGFHPELPASAIAAGADAVVHSTHKMLTAMTMGAMLHLQGELLDRNAVARALATVQSSSPSYPIMASIDLARRQLYTDGERLLGQAIRTSRRLCERIADMPWMRVVGPVAAANDGASADVSADVWRLDPLKLTLGDRTGTLGGFDLLRELAQDGCIAEMADPDNVLLTLGLSSGQRDADRLLAALHRIARDYGLGKKETVSPTENIDRTNADFISPPVLFQYHEVCGANVILRKVKAEEAEGFASHVQVVPYPPGVPLLFPGEPITSRHVRQLAAWTAAGSRVHGLNEDGSLTIRMNGDTP